ncbi:hypothetical protein [Streptomyces xanthophaeus]
MGQPRPRILRAPVGGRREAIEQPVIRVMGSPLDPARLTVLAELSVDWAR